MQLTIEARKEHGVAILNVSGRIVAGEECDTVRNTIKELLARNEARIVLNLAQVTRLDSTGIGMLVEAVVLAAKEGGRLKLVAVPRTIYNILYTHRLVQAFEFFDKEEEALASFNVQSEQPAG